MRRALLANVVVQVLIVVTGGLVRLTGSGLGCPTWPECVPGSYVPVVEQAEGFHKYIEFGNRTLTGVVGLAALGALVVTVLLVRRGRPRSLLVLGAAPLVLTVAQAVLGGITVLTQLHPVTVAAHFLVSMALIAVSVLLLDRLGQPDGPAVPVVRREVLALGTLLVLVGAVVLVLGTVVTGSGPHSGDADSPARFGLDPRTISWLHADTVLLFVGLAVGLLVVLRVLDAPRRSQRRAAWLLGITLAQGLVGYVQYLTDLPEALVLAHMLGASLLVVALTLTVAGLHERTRDDRAGAHIPRSRHQLTAPGRSQPLPRSATAARPPVRHATATQAAASASVTRAAPPHRVLGVDESRRRGPRASRTGCRGRAGRAARRGRRRPRRAPASGETRSHQADERDHDADAEHDRATTSPTEDSSKTPRSRKSQNE